MSNGEDKFRTQANIALEPSRPPFCVIMSLRRAAQRGRWADTMKHEMRPFDRIYLVLYCALYSSFAADDPLAFRKPFTPKGFCRFGEL